MSPPRTANLPATTRFPRTRAIGLAAAVALYALIAPITPAAQPGGPIAKADAEADAVTAELEALGLHAVLAEHLHALLEGAEGDRRNRLAEQLSAVYAQRLRSEADPDERARLEQRSRELIDRVPEADSYGLRLSLMRARYLPAERTAERARLLLAGDEAEAEALAAFRSIAAELGPLRDRLEERVQQDLERVRSGGRRPDALRAALEQSRRQRSLATYYLGWSRYYAAMLGGERDDAADALAAFGAMLGAASQRPSLNALPRTLLRYEHVARAAVGSALAYSILGEHGRAVRWLDEIEAAPELNPSIREQLFQRRAVVLAEAERWDELLDAVERRRRDPSAGENGGARLAPGEARLLAVLVLDRPNPNDPPAARRIARAAGADLVAADELGQVLDLSRRFGTLPLGDRGFVSRYVRAIRFYDDARAAHAAAGDPDTPTDDRALIEAYRRAAELLRQAYDAADATSFPIERARCGVRWGLCAAARGDEPAALERLERTHADAPPGSDPAEEALWLAVSVADRGVARGAVGTERLASLRQLYLASYPTGQRAARLSLASGGGLGARAARRALESIGPEDPLYPAAQRRLVSILYRAYRSAGAGERAEAANTLIDVADRVIGLGLERLERGDADPDATARGTVLVARQLLDAALGTIAEAENAKARQGRVEAATRALRAIDAVFTRLGVTAAQAPEWAGDDVAQELGFRRVQLAWAQDQTDRVLAEVEALDSAGSRFAPAAARFLFNRAAEGWSGSAGEPDPARALVRWGLWLIEHDAVEGEARLSVAAAVADASASLARQGIEAQAMRRIAVRMDTLLFEAKAADTASLRRLASFAEASGEPDLALRAWRRLQRARPENSEGWFEARHETIRLMSETNPDAARAALRQHAVLYPELGPGRWADAFRGLADSLGIDPRDSPSDGDGR